MTFELKEPLAGTWLSGHSDALVWLQFVGTDGKPEFTVMRKRHCLNVEYIVHKIPPELGQDLIVPYSFQDYVGEDYFTCDGRGFLVTDGAGGSVFRTGNNDFDNNYQGDIKVLEKITDRFCFVVVDAEFIFPIDASTKATLAQFFVKHPCWPQ